jgi:hypothetical protein
MKITLKTIALAVATFACAVLLSPGKADAYTHLYIHPAYGAVYVPSPGLSWYAVRAYYFGGPWSGPGFSYAGWDDYAARNGIGCRPGTIVKGGDGIWYNCQ